MCLTGVKILAIYVERHIRGYYKILVEEFSKKSGLS